MTELHKISVNLSDGQKRKLAKAYRDREEVSIKLAHKNLSGSDTLMVPKNTVNRLAKSKATGKGIQIKISRANVRKQTGSGILTSVLPVLRNVAPTIGKTLGLSALAGLASEGASQIIKKISGGQIFKVPNQHLFRLAMLSELLNTSMQINCKDKYLENAKELDKFFINILLRRRACARNVSFRISLRWLIHIINSVDKTKLSCNTPTDAAPQFL